MMELLKELAPLNRVFVSSDYDYSIDVLRRVLNFNIVEFSSETAHNGWVIPPKWNVVEARIIKNGNVILDVEDHVLHVICYSAAFEGMVSLEELRQHLHYDHRYEDAIPYHFRQSYRSWDRDWGFCVTRNFFESLEPGEYDIVIKTKEDEGILKVLEYHHAGEREETFVFVAHLDHPGMANDDLAGCVVGVELFKRLLDQKTKYSYKLVILQEIIGSEHYLGLMPEQQRSMFIEGLFLEMLGSTTPLSLQMSGSRESNIELMLHKRLSEQKKPFNTGEFGDIIANDEYVFEAYGIPMASLSRYPYPEYHCSKDNVSIIEEASLEESVDLLLNLIHSLENTYLVKKMVRGNVCLTCPQYSDFNLYVDPGQPAFGDIAEENVYKMRKLMNFIPIMNKPYTTNVIASKFGLSENEVVSYLMRWEKAGLLEFK